MAPADLFGSVIFYNRVFLMTPGVPLLQSLGPIDDEMHRAERRQKNIEFADFQVEEPVPSTVESLHHHFWKEIWLRTFFKVGRVFYNFPCVSRGGPRDFQAGQLGCT
jgi:hypothetical protein